MLTPYERKINYYETDQMSIVHHSNYIRFLEEARIHYMDESGMSYSLVEEQGILIPVLEVSVKYDKAIRFGDEICIYLKVTKFSQVKFSFSYEIRNKETGELHATGKSEHCFVDKDLNLVRLKKDYPMIYDKFVAFCEQVAATDKDATEISKKCVEVVPPILCPQGLALRRPHMRSKFFM